MSNPLFRQAIFISFLGHLTLFGIFTFSFGPRIPEVNFSRVCFWGAILPSRDLTYSRDGTGYKRGAFTGKSEISALDKISRENRLVSRDYSKPQVSLVLNQDKMVFKQKPMPTTLVSTRKEPGIMFYPRLPYYFALYFKDRQTAHIELMFQVASGERSSVLVKRKISSGNLEADLLSMRYISRYLFIQPRGFAPDKWQIVKIDLSTLND